MATWFRFEGARLGVRFSAGQRCCLAIDNALIPCRDVGELEKQMLRMESAIRLTKLLHSHPAVRGVVEEHMTFIWFDIDGKRGRFSAWVDEDARVHFGIRDGNDRALRLHSVRTVNDAHDWLSTAIR